MSSRMQLPLSQQRHSNVAVVRMTKNGAKLEIACYKNKVVSFRSGVETRLDEVLQIDRVFTNVSRGQYASHDDIRAVLGPGFDEQKALRHILEHGQLQVAQQERESEVDKLLKDISTIIAQKCVHEATLRPFPSEMIEQALRSLGVAIKVDQPAKKQALQFIRRLVDARVLPIARAHMRLRCVFVGDVAVLTAWCDENGAVCSVEGAAAPGAPHEVLVTAPPQQFRALDAFVRERGGAGSTVHVVENAVMETGEGAAADLDVVAASAAAAAASAAGVLTRSGTGVTGASSAVSSDGARRGDDAAKKAARGGGGKKQRGGRAHSDDDEEVGADDVVVPSLDVQLQRLRGDDDDSDGGGRKKPKKAAKKPAARPAAAAKPAPKPAGAEGSDEEDVVSERKKSKRAKPAATEQKPYDSADEFDYGEDDAGEEVA